jgi:outer membrane biogenesis lipoprotein LolB
MTRPLASALCMVTLLVACSSVPLTPAPPPAPALQPLATQFSLSGRFSAKTASEQVSGQFRYAQKNAERTLNLFSPLGTPLADIVATRDRATLTQANGSTQSAASLSDLLRTVIDLPVTDAMFSAWLQGLPSATASTTAIERDAAGLASRFVESGWEIVVSARMDAAGQSQTSLLWPPKRMRWTLQADTGTELRWVIDEWRTP